MRIVITALIMLATTPAFAEWVKVMEPAEAIFYIDPATIRKDGDLRRVWGLTDRRTSTEKGVLSRRTLSEYDCRQERERNLSYFSYSGPMLTGRTVNTGRLTPQAGPEEQTCSGGNSHWRAS